MTEAQTTNSPMVSIQSEVMPINTPYHVHSAMFGMKTESGDQYLIGPAFKTFLPEVGHRKSHWGMKIHTQTMIGRFIPFLSYEMMWGEYYIYGGSTQASVAVKSRKQGRGVFGVGYEISDRVQVFTGVSAQDYDPVKFYKRKKTPYKSPGVVMKVGVNVWD